MMSKKTFDVFNFIVIGVLVILALPKRFWYITLIIAAVPFVYYMFTCGGWGKYFRK